MGGSKYILHLFSGRRRPYDLQAALESHPILAMAWVLSLDVANDETNGDMMNDFNVH